MAIAKPLESRSRPRRGFNRSPPKEAPSYNVVGILRVSDPNYETLSAGAPTTTTSAFHGLWPTIPFAHSLCRSCTRRGRSADRVHDSDGSIGRGSRDHLTVFIRVPRRAASPIHNCLLRLRPRFGLESDAVVLREGGAQSPRDAVIFVLAPTAEEKGLYCAQYFSDAHHGFRATHSFAQITWIRWARRSGPTTARRTKRASC